MSSEFRDNLNAIASFIKETGNVTTTLASIVGGLSVVLILLLSRIEPPAWAIALISGTTGIGIAFDPNKSSIVQQQFQRPVDNVSVSTPSSGPITNVSDINVASSGSYPHPTESQYLGSESTTDNEEWLSPGEAAQRFR